MKHNTIISPYPNHSRGMFPTLRLNRANGTRPYFPNMANLATRGPTAIRLYTIRLTRRNTIRHRPLQITVNNQGNVPLHNGRLTRNLVLRNYFHRPNRIARNKGVF